MELPSGDGYAGRLIMRGDSGGCADMLKRLFH